MAFNEDSRVKIPSILHLMRLGYDYLSLKDPNIKWDESTNIFSDIFKTSITRINIRFHDLRHTWATRCIESGMPVAYVQYLGGWSSPKMMQRYINITPENLKELKRFGY